jgi:hypothetical protein
MQDSKKKMKIICVRLPKETWLFLKKASMNQEVSMNKVLLDCVELMKNKKEKTVDD